MAHPQAALCPASRSLLRTLLLAKSSCEEDSDDRLEEQTEEHSQNTWEWADVAVGANHVISFHIGFGDGVYPTF